MPRTSIDYNKNVIYKLIHQEDYENNNIYIGHTTNFTKRKGQHKQACNNPNIKDHNAYNYQYIRDNGGWNMWDMVEIEKFPCNDKQEAHRQERYWIDFYKSTLNKQLPTRTYAEWVLQNHDKVLEIKRRYNNKNRDTINEKSRIRNLEKVKK